MVWCTSEYMLAYIKKRRNRWIEENGPCKNCGSKDRLEVDHIDRTAKEIEVRHIWTRKESVREIELAKCQVLCYSCHKLKTIKENTTWKHGTPSGYTRHHCRCKGCDAAQRKYKKQWRLKQKLKLQK